MTLIINTVSAEDSPRIYALFTIPKVTRHDAFYSI